MIEDQGCRDSAKRKPVVAVGNAFALVVMHQISHRLFNPNCTTYRLRQQELTASPFKALTFYDYHYRVNSITLMSAESLPSLMLCSADIYGVCVSVFAHARYMSLHTIQWGQGRHARF